MSVKATNEKEETRHWYDTKGSQVCEGGAAVSRTLTKLLPKPSIHLLGVSLDPQALSQLVLLPHSDLPASF